jgi:hypothetical protein
MLVSFVGPHARDLGEPFVAGRRAARAKAAALLAAGGRRPWKIELTAPRRRHGLHSPSRPISAMRAVVMFVRFEGLALGLGIARAAAVEHAQFIDDARRLATKAPDTR